MSVSSKAPIGMVDPGCAQALGGRVMVFCRGGGGGGRHPDRGECKGRHGVAAGESPGRGRLWLGPTPPKPLGICPGIVVPLFWLLISGAVFLLRKPAGQEPQMA